MSNNIQQLQEKFDQAKIEYEEFMKAHQLTIECVDQNLMQNSLIFASNEESEMNPVVLSASDVIEFQKLSNALRETQNQLILARKNKA